MPKLSRAKWVHKFYWREGSKTFRENVGGKVIRAPKSSSIESLRRLEKGSKLREPTLAHPYGMKKPMSENTARTAEKLFYPKTRKF